MKEVVRNQSKTNPRLQCIFCGKWKRQYGVRNADGSLNRIMVAAQYENREIVDTNTGALADVCAEHYKPLFGIA